MSSDTLKTATFNVWHGLAGRGVVRFREFEDLCRREERFATCIRNLRELDPDILLLQELNPVSLRGDLIRSSLGGVFFGRPDQSGLKFFSRGYPENLATGLGILVRGRAQVCDDPESKRVPSYVRLSGELGFSGETFSFHLDEQRYAQFVSVQHASLGRILVANFHLHHGFERFPPLMRLLEAARHENKISPSQFQDLMPALDQARERRLGEIDRLLTVVHKHAHSYDGLLLGGDLNSTSDGAAYQALIVDGFSDLGQSKAASESSGGGPTWAPDENIENHTLQSSVGFDFPLPSFGNPELIEVYRAFDRLSRRIDFLFAKGSLAVPTNVRNVERFGFPRTTNAIAASDHFGVSATFQSGDAT